MNVWFVTGFVSCCGASLDESRLLTVRPYGVLSQGFVGTEIIARSLKLLDTVQGLETACLLVILIQIGSSETTHASLCITLLAKICKPHTSNYRRGIARSNAENRCHLSQIDCKYSALPSLCNLS